jgi:hypothetical protein
MSRRYLLAVSTGLAFACLSDGILHPPHELPHAAASRACGPADGPAVAIYLALVPIESLAPPTPYVRIAIWQPLSRLAGGSWVVAASDTAAAGWYFTGPNSFQVATGGRVEVNGIEPDTTVQGFADLTFPAVGRVTGAFRAAWIPYSPLCG